MVQEMVGTPASEAATFKFKAWIVTNLTIGEEGLDL